MSVNLEKSINPPIRLEMRGGVLGLDRQVQISGRGYSVSDKGKEIASGVLGEQQVDALKSHVQELSDVNPKKTYGLAGRVRDQLTESLQTGDFSIDVLTDPSDRPPQEYYKLRNAIIHSAPSK